MIYREFALAGIVLITTDKISDDRGYFARLLDYQEMRDRGLESSFAQDSVAFNRKIGTIRGLHYQIEPFGETKIIRCIKGAIFDVLVDVRRASPTFGQWISLTLEAPDLSTLYVPSGFAHGYQTLSNDTEVFYQITPAYRPSAVAGFHYADPTLAIPWPLANPIVSGRDQALGAFA